MYEAIKTVKLIATFLENVFIYLSLLYFMGPAHKSQSALEYMMTYGWAILVIVIVAAVLYSLGIFSPSSSLSTTITGFSNLGSVTAECLPNAGMVIQFGNSIGTTINVTYLNYTVNNKEYSISPNSANSFISPGSVGAFVLPYVCSSAGSVYSSNVIVTYSEPGSPLPGPYYSSGIVRGTVSTSANLNFTGGLAYTGGAGQGCYIGQKVFGITEGVLAPITNQYNGVYTINCRTSANLCNGWEFYGYIYLSKIVTFREAADDTVSTYIRPAFNGSGYGNWENAFAPAYNSNLTWSGCCNRFLDANFISSGTYVGIQETVSLTPGLYEISLDSAYDHACDGPWFSITGGVWIGPVNLSVWTNGPLPNNVTAASVFSNPISPGYADIENVSSFPSSLYVYTNIT